MRQELRGEGPWKSSVRVSGEIGQKNNMRDFQDPQQGENKRSVPWDLHKKVPIYVPNLLSESTLTNTEYLHIGISLLVGEVKNDILL